MKPVREEAGYSRVRASRSTRTERGCTVTPSPEGPIDNQDRHLEFQVQVRAENCDPQKSTGGDQVLEICAESKVQTPK